MKIFIVNKFYPPDATAIDHKLTMTAGCLLNYISFCVVAAWKLLLLLSWYVHMAVGTLGFVMLRSTLQLLFKNPQQVFQIIKLCIGVSMSYSILKIGNLLLCNLVNNPFDTLIETVDT